MAPEQAPFPSLRQAAALLLCLFLLEVLIGAALHDAGPLLGLNTAQQGALSVLLANGLVLSAVLHLRRIGHAELFHPSPNSAAATALLVVPPVLLLVPAVLLVDEQVQALLLGLLPLSLWEEQAFSSMVSGTLAAVVSTCILAPVLEEALFRGILLRGFLQQLPRWAAIAYSALFFGAAHLNIYQFVLAFWLGLLLGWLFERTQSLIPCIALHAAVNTSVVAMELNGQASGLPSSLSATPGAWAMACGAALAGALLLRRLLGSGPVSSRDSSR